MAGTSHEIRYAVLKHVALMVTRCPGIFDGDFKQFYCRFLEPDHVKVAKLDILPELTNEENVTSLVQELGEYVGDSNEEIAKKALVAIGRMAVKIPAGADSIINILLEFMEMDIDFVRSGVVCVVKDLLRKYPDRAGDVLPALPRCAQRVEDAEGKASVMFMLGEYGASMESTPYILETLIQGVEKETSALVKSTLLTATAKLFFRRAPECVEMFIRLLRVMLHQPDTTTSTQTGVVREDNSTDLRDRALFYYRLLKQDVEIARQVIGQPLPIVTTFTEERDAGLKQILYEEFNTLSVIYNKPADQFIDADHREKALPRSFVDEEKEAQQESSEIQTLEQQQQQGEQSTPSETNLLVDFEEEEEEEAILPSSNSSSTGESKPTTSSVSQKPSPNQTDSNTLDVDLLLDLQPSTTRQENSWMLREDPSIDQTTYQTQWDTLSDPSTTRSFTVPLHIQDIAEAQTFENALVSQRIYCMASGDVGTHLKFYFYALDHSNVYYFAELIVDKAAGSGQVTVKGNNIIHLHHFEQLLRACF